MSLTALTAQLRAAPGIAHKQDIAPILARLALGHDTAILPLLNGMAHLDKLAARFGPAHVLGGSTRIVADVDAEGRIHSFEALHDLNFGERDKSITPRIEAIQNELSNAGFDANLQPVQSAAMGRGKPPPPKASGRQ